MIKKDDLINQAQAIIRMGEKVLETESTDARQKSLVDETKFHDFRISALSYLSRVFAEKSDYYQSFKSEVTQATSSRTRRGIGILDASSQALKEGWLESASETLCREILLDMLNIAQAETDEHRVASAITISCTILEKHLRDLATAHDIPVENRMRDKTVAKRGLQLSGELYKKKLLSRQDSRTVVQQFELLAPQEDGSRKKLGPGDAQRCMAAIRRLIESQRD